MKTLKEAGISRTVIIDCIISRLMQRFGISKSKATEYFNESLAYNLVIEAIFDQVEFMIETGRRLDWSVEEDDDT